MFYVRLFLDWDLGSRKRVWNLYYFVVLLCIGGSSCLACPWPNKDEFYAPFSCFPLSGQINAKCSLPPHKKEGREYRFGRLWNTETQICVRHCLTQKSLCLWPEHTTLVVKLNFSPKSLFMSTKFSTATHWPGMCPKTGQLSSDCWFGYLNCSGGSGFLFAKKAI